MHLKRADCENAGVENNAAGPTELRATIGKLADSGHAMLHWQSERS